MARSNLDTVGNDLKSIRVWISGTMKLRRVSQKELAEYLGVSQQTVSNIINGTTELKVRDLLKIEEYFGERWKWWRG